MPWKVTATRTLVADYTAGLGTWISLHTADPGQTGASEVSGGSPAYARKQTTWGAASSGTATGSEVLFDVPPGTTVTHVGIWSASTSGTFREYADSADVAFTPQGQLKVTPSIVIPAG